jgi:hypothetical protein
MKTYCVFCEVVTVLSFPDLRNFQVHNFRHELLRKVKKKKKKNLNKIGENCAEIFMTWMKGQGCGRRILLADNTGDGTVRLQPIDLESVVESDCTWFPFCSSYRSTTYTCDQLQLGSWPTGTLLRKFGVSVLCTWAGEKSAYVLWLLTQPLELCTQPHSAWCTTGDTTTSEQTCG